MNGRPLPRSAPSAQGVSSSGILAFLDALEASPEVEPHGIIVMRHGVVVAEGWWRPYTAGRLQHVFSIGKAFVSSALGMAISDGLVSRRAPGPRC